MTSNRDSNDGGSDVFTDKSARLSKTPPFGFAQAMTAHAPRAVHQTRLGHGQRLLLHGLVDRRRGRRLDRAELVDAADTFIRQHQRAGLEGPLSIIFDGMRT